MPSRWKLADASREYVARKHWPAKADASKIIAMYHKAAPKELGEKDGANGIAA